MGIFGKREEIAFREPGLVAVEPRVVERLPDVGEFFLRLFDDLSEDSYRAVEQEIARVRHSNGSIPMSNLHGIGILDWKSGPLTLLVQITAKDRILVGVWASYGLSGKERRQVDAAAQGLVTSQGISAAATWAMATRPNKPLDVDFLGTQLLDSWNNAASFIRNGHVIKSFKKWRR